MIVNPIMVFQTMRVFSSSFSEYFPGDPLFLKLDSVKQPPLPYNYFYKDCSFSNMVSRPVSYYSDIEIKIMFENCLFYNCTANNKQVGGAFYINIPNGGCVFLRTCASCCQTESSYQLGYVYAHPDCHNNFVFSSFEKCSIDLVGYPYSLSLNSGMQSINNMNSSKNTGSQMSGFYSSSPNPLMFKYNTISNINNTNGYSVYITGNTGFLKYSNFVDFKIPTSVLYTIYLSGGYVMEYCIIKSWQNFAIYGGTSLIVRFCYFDKTVNQTTGSFVFQNSYPNTATYVLEHFSTAMCIAQNPAYPPQTPHPSATQFNQNPENICQTLPPPPTPAQTIPQDNTLSGASLTSLGSIMRIFAVSFIHIIYF